jgi:toxin-antitoxin system PIN domain toxin
VLLFDVNVMIYAFRPMTAAQDQLREWFEETLQKEAEFGLSELALSAVVRITTNPRIFPQPETTEAALDFANALRQRPHATILSPGRQHWMIFDRICRATNARAGAIADAYLAALALEHSATWVTLDKDFKRFVGLKMLTPPVRI